MAPTTRSTQSSKTSTARYVGQPVLARTKLGALVGQKTTGTPALPKVSEDWSIINIDSDSSDSGLASTPTPTLKRGPPTGKKQSIVPARPLKKAKAAPAQAKETLLPVEFNMVQAQAGDDFVTPQTSKAQPVVFGAPQKVKALQAGPSKLSSPFALKPDFSGANALNEQVGIRTGGRPQGTKSIFVDDTADESGDGLSDIDLSAFEDADFLDFNDGFISDNDDVFMTSSSTVHVEEEDSSGMVHVEEEDSSGMVHVEEEDSSGMVHIEEEMKQKSPIKKMLAKTPIAKSIPAGPANSANTTSKVDRAMAIKHLLLKQKLIKQQLAKEKAMLARVREAKKGKKKAVAPAILPSSPVLQDEVVDPISWSPSPFSPSQAPYISAESDTFPANDTPSSSSNETLETDGAPATNDTPDMFTTVNPYSDVAPNSPAEQSDQDAFAWMDSDAVTNLEDIPQGIRDLFKFLVAIQQNVEMNNGQLIEGDLSAFSHADYGTVNMSSVHDMVSYGSDDEANIQSPIRISDPSRIRTIKIGFRKGMESWGLWDPISRTVPIFRVVGVLDNSFLLGLGQTFGNRSQRGVEVFGLVAELRRMLAMFGVFFDDRTMSYWASPSGALRFTTTTGNVEAQPSTKRVDRGPNRAAVATTATGPNALVNKEVSRTALKCTDKVPIWDSRRHFYHQTNGIIRPNVLPPMIARQKGRHMPDPLWVGEIPRESLVNILFTATRFMRSDGTWGLGFNIVGGQVMATLGGYVYRG